MLSLEANSQTKMDKNDFFQGRFPPYLHIDTRNFIQNLFKFDFLFSSVCPYPYHLCQVERKIISRIGLRGTIDDWEVNEKFQNLLSVFI